MGEENPDPLVLGPVKCQRDNTINTLYHYQKQAVFTDFKIKVQEKVINCHKNILSATCPYFEALFSSNMKEAQQGEITMETLEFTTVHAIIQYLYSQPISVDWKDVEKMIAACDLLQIKPLMDVLVEYIAKHLSPTNCIGWWNIADKFNMFEVGKQAKSLMCTKFKEVSCSKEFKMLSLSELIDYINNEDIVIGNSDAILQGCLQWIHYDVTARQKMLLDLMKQVTLKQCSVEGLQTLTAEFKDLINDPDVKEFIYETVLPMLNETAKKKVLKLVVLGGMEKFNDICNSKCWQTSSSIHYKLESGLEWEVFTEFPTGSQAHQSPVCLLVDGFAVMCGGRKYDKNTKYNAKTKTWFELPPTPVGLQNPSALLCSNSIYLLGGVGKDSVYHLDLTTLKWHTDPPMLHKQNFPIATNLGDDIYVVHNKLLNGNADHTLQHYKKATNNWMYKSNLPDNAPSAYGSCLVSLKEDLYLVGGDNRICAQYTTTTNTWTLLSRPMNNHFTGPALVSDGTIYLFSGGDAYQSDCIEEYNIDTNQWKMSHMKLPRGLDNFTVGSVSFL